MHAAATSKVENSAQGLSCKLKFVHVAIHDIKQAYTVRYQIGIFLANGTASYM
jgi:hypothetical protein